jgi:hypothetical protein
MNTDLQTDSHGSIHMDPLVYFVYFVVIWIANCGLNLFVWSVWFVV